MKYLSSKMPVWSVILLQAFVVLLLLLSLRNCSKNIENRQSDTVSKEEYLKGKQKFESIINEKNQQLTSQKQVLINKDKDFEKLLLGNTTLKRLVSQTKFETETVIPTTIIEYKDRVEYIMNDFDTVGLKFGSELSKEDEWFSFSGQLEKSGFKLDSLSVRNKYVVTVGTKREKWFKSKETYVEIFNENPYTRTISMNNIKVIEKKKWWNSGWVKFGSKLS